MTGYLATVTSASENTYIKQTLSADAWFGASDAVAEINSATGTTTFANQAAAEGRWYWVTGPEKGICFSIGNINPVTQVGRYANWNGGEPNNCCSGEHYGQIYSSGATGAWNDLVNGSSLGFVVEYGDMPGDPTQELTSNTTVRTIIGNNSISTAQSICNGASASGLTGNTPFGGYGGYTYQWLASTSSSSAGFSNASGSSTSANYSPGSLTTTTWFRRIVLSGVMRDTSSAIQITVNPAINRTVNTTNVSCNGGSNGTATVVVSGGTSPYTYSWNGGNTSSTRTGLNTGTYTVTVTDAAGCTSSGSITITQPTALSSSASQTNVACNGSTTGTATVSVSGGTSGYTYAWSPSGGTAATATGLSAGTYTVLVTDANSCTLSRSYTITQPTALSASTSQTNVNCNGQSNATASILMSGGTPSYTYAWSNGSSSATNSNLGAGTYTVTVTDANGCTLNRSYTITQPTAISSTPSSTNVSCNGGSNGSASVSVSGGTSPFTYSWTNGASSAAVTGLSAGTYTVTITDANNCTAQRSFTVTQPTAISVSTSKTNVACNGNSTGSAGVSVSGGTSGYTYSWSPSGGTSANASGLSAGTYSVLITDANSCTAQRSFTITQPTALSVSTSQTNVDCNGNNTGSAGVSVSGGISGYTYSWSPSGGTSASVTGLSAGNYTVLITDANNCTAQRSFTISQPTALNVSTSQTNVACNGLSTGSAGVTVNGGTSGYTYVWSPSGGTSATATGLTAGNYTVLITDANNCTAQRSFTLTQPTALNASTSHTNTTCNSGNDGTASVNVSGGTAGYTYSWSPAGGTSATAINLAAGNYTVNVVDANNCATSQNVTISEPAAIVLAAQVNDPSCNGGLGSVNLSASGGTGSIGFTWGDGSTSANRTDLGAGTYVVISTDANGCTEFDNVVVNEPDAIVPNLNVTQPICFYFDGSASVQPIGGTGALNAQWSNGTTGSNSNGLGSGTFNVVVTDANGCTVSESFTITHPDTIVATAQISDAHCGQNDGAVVLNVSGGIPGNYSYQWNGLPFLSSQAGNLAAGTYIFTVFDAAGCQIVDSVTVNDIPPTPSTAATVPVVGDCAQAFQIPDGTPAGGVYSGTGVSNNIFDPSVGVGVYTITYSYTDQWGCVSTDQTDIEVVSGPNVSLQNFSNVGPCNGLITLSGGFPSGGYYEVNGIQMISFNADTIPGTYQINYVYQDPQGCSGSASQSITVDPLPAVTLSNFNDVGSCSGIITLTGGTPAGGAFSGTGVQNGQFDPSTGAGTYSISYSYTDANGCSGSATQSITVAPMPTITITPGIDVIICDNDSLLISASTAAGNSITWSNSSSGNAIYISTPGIYYATATDGFGCSTTSSTMELSSKAAPQVILPAFSPVCTQNVWVPLSGGQPQGGTYSGAQVSNGIFNTPSVPGNYTVSYTYSSSNGCSATASRDITVVDCTSIEEIAAGQMILFPNPTDQLFTVRFISQGVEISNIRFHNGLGQIVGAQNYQDQLMNGELRMDASAWAPGVYLMRVGLSDGKEISKPIIIR
jgi:hypothetical protein